MILPKTALFHFMEWIDDHLGFDVDLGDDGIVESLDEQEVDEQLQHGRD